MSPAEIYAQFKERGGIAELARAQWRLTGADRVRFLNGQVSNDVRKLRPGASLHACVLTAKGKMCADVRVSAGDDFLRVDAEASLREPLGARLERYLIADDVVLDDVTDELGMLHLIQPPGAHTSLDHPRIESYPANRFGFPHTDFPGTDFVGPRDELKELLSEFSKRAPLLDDAMLETIRIEAGVPRWGFELNEDILPQEAGLDHGAIDFHKGCYVGQEVISRIKSVGHVNKQLCGLASLDDAPLRAGMRLFAPDAPEKEAGWITSAAFSFGLARPVALGYLKRGVTADVLVARDDSGVSRVEVKNLPFVS